MTGNEMRELRAEMKLKQELLAKELDVTRATISAWESKGEEMVPRMTELAMIALRHLPEHSRKWVTDGVDISGGAE